MTEEEAAEQLVAAMLRTMKPEDAKKAVRSTTFKLEDLKIINKDGELVPLVPNKIQKRYMALLDPYWKRKGEFAPRLSGVRDIIVKARKEGLSTLINGLFFIDTVNNPHTESVLVADETTNTQKLFSMIQRFYENLDPELRPDTKYANKNEFYWPKLDSWYRILTAGTPNAGRGGTPRNFHGSEIAVWPNADEIMLGLGQSVPRAGNIILESTANGVGTYQHRLWVRAVNKNSVYRPVFFPWFEEPTYRSTYEEVKEMWKGPQDAEEEQMMARFNLDAAQMLWYRLQKLDMGDEIKQEFPGTPDEAFLSSGRPYFSLPLLSKKMAVAEQSAPLHVNTVPEEFVHLGEHLDKLTVYKEPEEGKTYVVVADTAEGLTEEGDPDFDSADVVCRETGEQVAHFHGLLDTHKYGLVLADLGWWYNTALVAVERNNHGHAVLNALLYTADYPEMDAEGESGVYYHEDYDAQTPLQSRKPGWPTTPKTKYFALEALNRAFTEDTLLLRHPATVAECMSFVKKPRGRAGAEQGQKDDRVMSIAIAAALQDLGFISYTGVSVGTDVRSASVVNPMVVQTVRTFAPPGFMQPSGTGNLRIQNGRGPTP